MADIENADDALGAASAMGALASVTKLTSDAVRKDESGQLRALVASVGGASGSPVLKFTELFGPLSLGVEQQRREIVTFFFFFFESLQVVFKKNSKKKEKKKIFSYISSFFSSCWLENQMHVLDVWYWLTHWNKRFAKSSSTATFSNHIDFFCLFFKKKIVARIRTCQ